MANRPGVKHSRRNLLSDCDPTGGSGYREVGADAKGRTVQARRAVHHSVLQSVTGTALDIPRCGGKVDAFSTPLGFTIAGRQMRHSLASVPLQGGALLTYVSRQLGHRDASIT